MDQQDQPLKDDPFIPMMAYPRQSQKDKLDEIHKKTRIPRSELVREALDDLFSKYADSE